MLSLERANTVIVATIDKGRKLGLKPLTVAVVKVAPVWSKSVLPKALDSETETSYWAAPAEVPQLKTSEVTGSPTAPFVGEARTGAAGAAMIVVKLHTLDHNPVPPAFFAFASQ